MSDLKNSLESALKGVCKEWKRAKRRQDRVSGHSLNRMRYRSYRTTIREAAYRVMEEAYQKASGGGKYPANARQIYYAARPKILELTDKAELGSQYFCQVLLKDYLDDYGNDWDVVFDARGHFVEPHTEKIIGLGGIDVRQYINDFTQGEFNTTPIQKPATRIDTVGPHLRYGAVLFIEKEGFAPLLEAAKIAERYDIAIASTKGMPVAALCDLLGKIRHYGIKAYVVHDFDKAGFSIVKTLRQGARGSRGHGDVVDLGFRLDDIEGLERESVGYPSDPRHNLSMNGATDEEMAILYQGHRYGERVELNAMTTDQFVGWLETKLDEHGIKKVMPNEEILQRAYRRACFLMEVHKKQEEVVKKLKDNKYDVPPDIQKRIQDIIDDQQEISWDDALWQIAEEDFSEATE